MKNKAFGALVLPLLTIAILGFVGGNPDFNISKKDVELHIPKGFPKPIYDFKDNKLSPAAFLLGRRLFYDPVLSKDQTVSCASCHQRIAAFAHIDHALSHGIYAKIGTRNVPAIQNMIWKDAFMADGGVNHLEVQPINPITSPIEMDETLAGIVQKLRSLPTYPPRFQAAFGDTAITSQRILKALTQFTGLMISADSRYDRYMAGKDTFSLQEKNGLELFRANCATCHKEPLFTDNSYRNNGIRPDSALNDIGRGKITNLAADNYKFKVPSLRNVEMTYPYMHDGRFRKLNDVMRHYAKPEAFAPNADPTLKTIGPLTDKERVDLVAFLLTLTDKTFLYDRRFADPNMEQ
jgi:cytochrome c peroxidase